MRTELHQEKHKAPTLPLRRLEQLPYLSAVILEGLRVFYGASHRLSRVSPREPVIYKGYVIPPGTAISMTTVFMHDDTSVFPEPRKFCPERWLDLEAGARRTLDRSFVAFGRGTRSCLGQHLAMAEIYISLAALFEQFDLRLYETTRDDVDVAHDFFAPQVRQGSAGLRVTVH